MQSLVQSLEHRVLSVYTAFLALEVAQGGVICYDCVDETNLEQILVEGTEVPTPTEQDEIILTNPDVNTANDDFDTAGDGIAGGGVAGPPVDPVGAPENEEQATATNNILVDSLLSIQASPNPFSVQTTISIKKNLKLLYLR